MGSLRTINEASGTTLTDPRGLHLHPGRLNDGDVELLLTAAKGHHEDLLNSEADDVGWGHLHPRLTQKAESKEAALAETAMGVTWPWPLEMMELLKGPEEDAAEAQERRGLFRDVHPVRAVGLPWSRPTVAKEHQTVPLNDS